MRTVDPAKHEARRAHILAAAARCFARKGFGQTRTADICAEAGMSSGNLFHYFDSKHAIFAALVAQEGDETAALFAELSTADPWAALTGVFELIVDLADGDYARLALEISAEAGRDERIADLVTANDRTLRTGLAELVERATAAGQIDPGLPADTAATWLAAVVDGLFNRVAVDPAFRPASERETLRVLLERVLRKV
ncbi:TetR/AcrR family transcriptional regulator [Actinokineospora sp. HUAS TT18]|uniref:TetR/AcrR family transcriptional regulator n=1 Tax=Actinokineospora sp. HUAS TT18 TaxID=3447451 RepID=UPI003F51E06B